MTSAVSPSAIDSSTPFADELRAFAAEDRRGEMPANPVLFYGSSSIRLWGTLQRDFAGWPVVNRGFGGSTLADCVREYERIAAPLQPRALVLYAGDNDLDQGASPRRVLELFEQLAAELSMPTIVISIKASPCRFWNVEKIRQANGLLCQAIAGLPQMQWIDLFTPMLDEHGRPKRSLYGEDGLHLSDSGYRLWTAAVRERLMDMGL